MTDQSNMEQAGSPLDEKATIAKFLSALSEEDRAQVESMLSGYEMLLPALRASGYPDPLYAFLLTLLMQLHKEIAQLDSLLNELHRQ